MTDQCPRCEQPIENSKVQYCPHCHVLLSKYPKSGSSLLETEHRSSTTQALHNNPQLKNSNFTQMSASQIPATGFSSFVQKDKGLWSLLAANLFTIVLALYEAWELHFIMTIYASQSLLIGLGIIMRMLNLKQFSTSGFKINGKPAKEEPATRGKVALFFLLHFGTFHFVYFGFLFAQHNMSSLPWFSITLCIFVFAVQQAVSVRDDIREDEGRKPNIGTLMFLPYARIVPMHLMIILGGWFAGSLLAVLIFLLLKVAADLVMYVVELYALYPKQRKLPG